MKQYEVISGSCPLVSQRVILQKGDRRPASFFNAGQAETLVTRSFLKEVEELPDVPAAPAPEETPKKVGEVLKEVGEVLEEVINGEEKTEVSNRRKELEALTIPVLSDMLIEKKIKFPTGARKPELVTLCLDNNL